MIATEVRCDRCAARYPFTFDGRSLAFVQRTIRDNGWTRNGNGETCPTCAPIRDDELMLGAVL